jgi:phthalate 4,5-dioxygenase
MAIVRTRQVLHRAIRDVQEGRDPPGLTGASQRVRAASVLLERGMAAKQWASSSLVDALDKPVFTV